MASGVERRPVAARSLPPLLRQFTRQGWSRRRLARRVREHSEEEHRHRLRAGTVEFRAVEVRSAAYERMAVVLDDLDRAVSAPALARLRQFLSERLPLCDYGPFARTRDARVASILGELEETG